MPMYFFHQQTGDDVLEDPEGTELPGLDAARTLAVDGMREMLGSCIRWSQAPSDRIIGADESGRELLSVEMTEVLPESIGELLRDESSR